mgnify:CR=1 FL=1|jgi:lipopolysaccharide transport system ATP-binding protein
MNEIIKVKNIAKSYTINHEKQLSYHSFRDSISNRVKSLFKVNKNTQVEEFWALNDISFSVNIGERIGVIGKNGAGKSTLLKILSRITEPTKGEIRIKGRVASLLEVGTGFHPELTGRENIFLNGAILGMTRTEIKSKFNDIVEFSEIEKFLDTPVKRYSSGMYVRLAFAVAAHLEPEILVVDEVLAVGDKKFQDKCLGKMKDITGKGKTILFVSHNMAAINSFCDRCIYLEAGKVKAIGPTAEITNMYLNSDSNVFKVDWTKEKGAQLPGDHVVKLRCIRLVDEKGDELNKVLIDQKIGIELEYQVLEEGFHPIPGLHLFSSLGEKIFGAFPGKQQGKLNNSGVYRSTMWIPDNFLNDESYNITVSVFTDKPRLVHVIAENIINFGVIDNADSLTRVSSSTRMKGMIRPNLDWTIEYEK